MQAPDTCTSVSFECKACGPINIDVTIAPFQNGQVMTFGVDPIWWTVSLRGFLH
jgi:hypothetical protein